MRPCCAATFSIVNFFGAGAAFFSMAFLLVEFKPTALWQNDGAFDIFIN
jgi:hypothetical protein